jgi:uncharacterized protein (DUF1015 family)
LAVVRPFRAVTYAHEAGADISALTAPPYDVISPAQREALLDRDPHNVVALELPEGPLDPSLPSNRYETGGRRWREWRTNGVLADDATDAVYVLEQRFELEGRAIRRRAFIAAVDLVAFSEGVVLPHERTLPKALTDRLSLTRATAANLSQVLGLFSDPARRTDALLDPAGLGEPMLTAADADGVTSTLWAIRDPADVAAVSEALAGCRVFIADGHHRYTTALAYRDERRAAAHGSEGRRPYDSVMMALVNMDDPELCVLPTHRVADAEGGFDEQAFLAALSERFDVTPAPADPLEALSDMHAPATFVVRTRSAATFVARLKHDVDVEEAIPLEASHAWKSLDVAVLQELVLRPLLGIHPDRPESLDRLSFVKDAAGALAAGEEHDVVFLLRPTRMDQLRAVSLGGELMPQKSTYFYPKLLSGLVMRDLG